MTDEGIVVGIDASRNRSGGAKVHLRGILGAGDPREHGVRQVHVWSYRSLLYALPDAPWLTKHHDPALEAPLWRQVAWQRWRLPAAARAQRCDVLLNTDAGSVCRFRPAVTMSRDMLSYERGEMQRYGWSKARLRLVLLRGLQNRSLRFADGAVFLTDYAAHTIGRFTGALKRVAIIPHGVATEFKHGGAPLAWPRDPAEPIEVLYVSNAAPYKHQWHVVRAVAALRAQGRNLHLTLVGGGSGAAQQRLDDEIARSDPRGEFVRCPGFADPASLPTALRRAHLFVFASSCENMPNTLVEAMAAGLPIACSDRGPMPEVLADAGTYFDPEQPASIANALDLLIVDPGLRQARARRARELAENYSWDRCARETWAFLRTTIGR